MNIKEFNEVYEMYMKKSKEELAMILTINDYNKSMEITEQVNDKLMESIMESINLPKKTVEGKDTTPQDLVKKPEPKKPYSWNDPDMFKIHPDPGMFRIHPEDGPIFEEKPGDIYLGTYCPYNSSGKCDRCGGLCSVCPLYQKSIITTTTSDTTTSSDLLNFGLTDDGKTRCPLTKEMVDFYNNSECRECKLFGDCITGMQGVTNSNDDIKLEEGASTCSTGPYWMGGYEYCPFVKGGKCVKGDNRKCDGCDNAPRSYVTSDDLTMNITADPNVCTWATTSTANA